jgi:hypothetical protein
MGQRSVGDDVGIAVSTVGLAGLGTDVELKAGTRPEAAVRAAAACSVSRVHDLEKILDGEHLANAGVSTLDRLQPDRVEQREGAPQCAGPNIDPHIASKQLVTQRGVVRRPPASATTR